MLTRSIHIVAAVGWREAKRGMSTLLARPSFEPGVQRFLQAEILRT